MHTFILLESPINSDGGFLMTLIAMSAVLTCPVVIYLLSKNLSIMLGFVLGVFSLPFIFIIFLYLSTLSVLVPYIGFTYLAYIIIKQIKPSYSDKQSFRIILSIAIIIPIILYSINGNAYSEKGYIKRAHEVLGLDPSGSKRSDLYPYYDHIKSCTFNWKSKIPDLDFMLLRLAGRQKYLVTIDHQRVIFNRYGEQFKNLGKSQPYTYCGG